jgi:hypothetical protein
MKNPNHHALRPTSPLSRSFTVVVMVSAIIILFVRPAISRADGFTNFGPGSSYNTTVGNPVGNAFDGNNYAEGDTFTPLVSESFSSLRIALSCASVCTDNFDVSLTRSTSGAPGAVLENFVVSAASLGVLGANNVPLVLNAVNGPMLAAGTQYWITVSSDLNNSIAWNLNSSGDMSAEAISLNGGLSWLSPSGLTPGAFEVQGVGVVGVPEPACITLLLTGIIAVIGVLLVIGVRRI